MHLSQYQNLTNTYVNTKINSRITTLAKKKDKYRRVYFGKPTSLITTTEIGMQLSAAKAIRKRQQNRTEQNRTEQNRTEQNRTEQNRTEQNRIE